METQTFIILGIIGLMAGALSGVIGLGGAVVIIPSLVMILGYTQHVAQGTTLMMMVFPVGALATFHYYKAGFVDIKTAIVLSVFFFVGGYFGARMGTKLPQALLQKVFAVLLAGIAIKMWFQKSV